MTVINTAPFFSDPAFSRLFKTLNQSGETRFVGGTVRDALVGHIHNDIDLATTLVPQDTIQQATDAGFKIIPTGLEHGTVTAVLERGHIEITTLRRDVLTDGRHAVVAFTTDWQEDALRRDFTINALSADATGKVYDYYHGIEDLHAAHVRFIGDATARIQEDYLRILRFFRFTSRFGKGAPDPEALKAIKTQSGRISTLSGERILTETLKLLDTPRAPEMWDIMTAANVTTDYLPQARDTDRLARVIGLEKRTGLTDSFRRLLSLLPILDADDVIRIGDRLKLSGEQKKRLTNIAFGQNEKRLDSIAAGDYAKALYRTDPVLILDLFILKAATMPTALETRVSEFYSFVTDWKDPQFPLGGDNLMELGLKPGPIFGQLLAEVEAWWMAHNFEPTMQQCFAELKRIWKQRKAEG